MRSITCMFIVSLLFLPAVSSGQGAFMEKPPPGGVSGADDLNIVAFDFCTSHPEVLYTAVYGRGVYKSTDGGKQWFQTYALAGITSVAADPGSPDIAYATEDG